MNSIKRNKQFIEDKENLNSTEEKTINKNNMSIAKSFKEDNEVDDSVIFNTALKEALNIISMKENKEENIYIQKILIMKKK